MNKFFIAVISPDYSRLIKIEHNYCSVDLAMNAIRSAVARWTDARLLPDYAWYELVHNISIEIPGIKIEPVPHDSFVTVNTYASII